MVRIYTRTGDTGETGLFGGPRVKKHSPRVEAYGTVDELNAAVGVVRAHKPPPLIDQTLEHVQHELFAVGAELATPTPRDARHQPMAANHVARLEECIDVCEEELEPLKRFILPGGPLVAAQLHAARAVCRRAERKVVELAEHEELSPHLVVYLNRLSDLLFVLARLANSRAKVPDVKWEPA